MHRRQVVQFLVVATFAVLAALSWSLFADERTRPAPVTKAPGAKRVAKFLVTIRTPSTPMVDSGLKDFHAKPVMIRCATCHDGRAANVERTRGEDLKQFHQGMQTAHGNLTCLSCHDAKNYDALRLADGRSIPYAESMRLCAQCHGPQKRDYDHGAHGGMQGAWDLTKGGRVRNHCIDCHDAHAPKYPKVMPVFPPVDRFPIAGGAHPEGSLEPKGDRHGRP